MTRAERRNYWERAKRKAARLWLRWHRPRGGETRLIKSWISEEGVERLEFYTEADIAREVAQIAEVHGRSCNCYCCTESNFSPKKEIEARGFPDELEHE